MITMTRFILALFVLVTNLGVVRSEDSIQRSELKAIGGHWFMKEGEKPLYFYDDAGRLVDLFSYHMLDSNEDGVENLRITHDDDCLIIQSQGYPNHATAIFPNSGNPNSILVQDHHFRLPLQPKLAEHITRLPMGPIGMALNGVVFFNPFEAGGMNAVEGYSEVWLDSCCGHPQQSGVYHYHKYPSCVKSPFADDGKQHSPILGFAFDGFPVYGPYESEKKMAMTIEGDMALDVCNGHTDPQRGYHYHVTPGRFPYILGGYAGVVEPSNNRGLRWSGTGPIIDNTEPGTRMENALTSVRPGTTTRGKAVSIQFELSPENASRWPLPQTAPHWIQIGPYTGKEIGREGNVVTATFEIPEDAAVGITLDCHLEFGSKENPSVIKKNDAFRIVE
jgi:hypothetical protein